MYVAIIVTALTGCATSARPPSTGMEYFIQTPTHTYYFQIAPQRICYSFHVAGEWEMGRASGLLRRTDNRALAGVLLWSIADVGAGSMDGALRAAAERSARGYESSVGAFPWTLVPFERFPGALAWHPQDFWREGRRVRLSPKWFVPVGEEWLAEFTIGAPVNTDADAFVDDIIRSLSTTREPGCYEERMRQLGVAPRR